jgi:hypothetical protein
MAGAMASALAVHVNGLVRGVVHQREKLLERRRRRRFVRRHRNPEELHPEALHGAGLARIPILRQIDDGFDTERFEISVIVALRLGTAIVVRVDAAEVVDVNGGGRCDGGWVRPERRREQQTKQCGRGDVRSASVMDHGNPPS